MISEVFNFKLSFRPTPALVARAQGGITRSLNLGNKVWGINVCCKCGGGASGCALHHPINGRTLQCCQSGQESDLMATYSLTYIEMVAGASQMRLSSEHRATEHGRKATDVGLDLAGVFIKSAF